MRNLHALSRAELKVVAPTFSLNVFCCAILDRRDRFFLKIRKNRKHLTNILQNTDTKTALKIVFKLNRRLLFKRNVICPVATVANVNVSKYKYIVMHD